MANFAEPEARAIMAAQCLGTKLRRGIILHGGFFLGARDFYQGLHDLSDAERESICMTGVDKTNQLDLNPRLYQLQRVDARFINTRSEEHTSELQSLMRNSYAVFCLKKNKPKISTQTKQLQ